MQLKYQDFEKRYIKNTELTGNRNLMSKYKKQSKKSNSIIDRDYWKLLMEMINFGSLFPISDKNEFAEVVAEDYEKETGYKMGSPMLSALADFILDDILANRNPDKVTDTDYPILSYSQIYKRGRREVALDTDIVDKCEVRNRRDYVKKRRTTEIADNK